jgi:flagellin
MDLGMQKLSSGLRINHARDDAAGLAVSEKMRAQIRGLQQASRNAQDGVALIQTAEGWMNETHAILQRMGELAVQAANGTYTTQDRAMIQVEVDQLTDEIDRIAEQAEFNTMPIISGKYASSAMAPEATGENQGEGGIWIHLGANMDQREKVFINAMNTKVLFSGAPAATGTEATKTATDEAATVTKTGYYDNCS